MSVDQFLLSADTTDLNYPEIRPTLDLNFARVKALDPRITFTRSSGGSYVGADGLIKYAGVNEARFDHDPETGESLGLLVEEARTNLVDYSETLQNFENGGTVTKVLNAAISPDGQQNGLKLQETTTDLLHRCRWFPMGASLSGNTTYALSIYAKIGERSIIQFAGFTGDASSSFNLSNGVAFGGNCYMINVGNGWWRCVKIYTAPDSPVTGSPYWDIRLSNGTTFSYTGDGTSGIYLWGAQLEQGAFPTSYIPTQGSTRTRAADDARIIGKNFSEWYRQDEGTVLVNLSKRVPFHTDYINARTGLVAITQATFRGIYIDYRKDAIRVDGASRDLATFAVIGNTSSKSPNILKSALSYSIINSTFSFISNLSQNVNSQTLTPTVNKDLFIGRNVASGTSSVSQYTNGTISRLTYFPKRLPNAQLQALTR
jgi:hypothetical protein